ncbi:MAG: FAD-binding oxidoreductase, partial [Deferribacterota bacterium]|nr:FAD-binding oxidoreductase [Deferribacterota bacterium]
MSFNDNVLLKKKLKGELHSDEIYRYLLSTDGSIYKIVPEAVIYPKDVDDVVKVLAFCKDNQLSIHPRGSGSGICGAALGSGYVLDFTKFMNKILKVDLNERYIICEAGVKGGKIKETLENSGLFFPVDPSSFDYASVGGMYNTNASGSHSIAYGNFNDYVLDVEILFSTGKLMWLSEIEKKEYKDLDNEFKQIFDLYNANKSDIAGAYPNLRCNVSGYNLRNLVVNDRLKLINLFAGSEGTLGIVTKLKLRLIDKPKYNILIVAYFDDINKSVNAVNIIQSKNPSAIEIMDKSLLGLAVEKNKT